MKTFHRQDGQCQMGEEIQCPFHWEMDTRVLFYFGGKVLQNSFAVQGSGIDQER